MANVLQGDPPPFLKPWFREHGKRALKKLEQATEVSPPTLRKVYRQQPVRTDVAWAVARVIAPTNEAQQMKLVDLMLHPPAPHV